MRKQVVEFVSHSERRSVFDFREAFQFRKDRKMPWLQKVCFAVLRKLEAFYLDEKITFERHVFETGTFMKRLLQQEQNLQDFFCERPERLLIGVDDFNALMNEDISPEFASRFGFQGEYYHNHTLCGLKVEVIPWMRGILVIPKLHN